uniref:Structure-specific endonuclease subunit SLX4 n=1 Tax=Astyanax mexicanus TaxID=7994 RepID=A0A3B1ICX5_ASTMX
MSPQLRTQHINRCLDESESSSEKISEAPAAPASALQPRVPECPICGRGFKSEKSRSTHLKRCSASMGVSPAELLQALQRQASESLSDSAAEQEQPRGRRRPNASEPSMPVKKKAKKRAPRMDEDTMVALALSRSLLEQEKQRERDIEEERQIQAQLSSPPAAAAPVLQWRPGAVAHKNKNQVPLVPITPMPGFSDMDTPELRKRLDSYGVRPLPKKQMVLKLKEIHHYTHQLMSSESEEEDSPRCRPKTGANPFKLPTAPPPVSPRKLQFGEEEQEVLPASQDSSTSSTAESERSNPELCDSEEEGSDSEGVTASQAVVREKDKLLAVRSFIVSDPALYGRVLQYQPLSLSDLKARLRAAGIRLGTAKLLDFLDSQCITSPQPERVTRPPHAERPELGPPLQSLEAQRAGGGREELSQLTEWCKEAYWKAP